MLYSVTFLTCGLVLFATAFNLGGFAWMLLWPGVSFLVVGLAYLKLGPRVFGKRGDGRMAWWNCILLLPFLVLTGAVWHLVRFISREPACHQITPALYVGRRLYPHEIPAGVTLVIDLTAEFSEPAAVLAGWKYRCLPTLDARPPNADGLRQLVEEAVAWPGGVLIHCANGHGRSATVAAAILLVRGLAADVRQAEALLREKRPGIRLKPAQRQAAAAFINPTRTSFAAPAQS